MDLAEFLQHRWEDGAIQHLLLRNDHLTLSIKDWRGEIYVVEFGNVNNLVLDEYRNEDISHVVHESNGKELVICFHSAWDAKIILRFTMEVPPGSQWALPSSAAHRGEGR